MGRDKGRPLRCWRTIQILPGEKAEGQLWVKPAFHFTDQLSPARKRLPGGCYPQREIEKEA